MELKNKISRSFKVNLFADFLLNQIPEHESTIIQVVDLENFWVIKGKTSSKDILEIVDLKNEFLNKYNEYFEEDYVFQTIDLIQYDCEMVPQEKLRVTLHNSENCIYHPQQLEEFKNGSIFNNEFTFELSKIEKENQTIISTFPHGHSLDQGRSLYYYSKLICYSIIKCYLFESIIIEIGLNNPEENFKIYSIPDLKLEQKLTSAVLDCFDFDINRLNKKLLEKGFELELMNPNVDFDFLVNPENKLEIF